jgi:uncharacterized Zn finger protein (UPF0148 family)
MNTTSRPRASAAPVLVLCRQCVQYVFEGTVVCPHCRRDATEMGLRYENEYLALETIARLDRALERRRMQQIEATSESAAEVTSESAAEAREDCS